MWGEKMYRAGIVTISDKGFAGEREDKSALVIREMLGSIAATVVAYKIVPDEPDRIKEALISLVDEEKVDLILTTGGTGFSPRDNTPEATKSVIEREVPGIPEAIRWEGVKKTPRAILSRAVAGIRHQTLIINLPGSPKGVRESLEAIMPALPHGLEVLTGRSDECALRDLPEPF